MKKRLTPEQLRDVFTKCTSREATWQEVDMLKDHVEAIEGEVSALKSELEYRDDVALERSEREEA